MYDLNLYWFVFESQFSSDKLLDASSRELYAIHFDNAVIYHIVVDLPVSCQMRILLIERYSLRLFIEDVLHAVIISC